MAARNTLFLRLAVAGCAMPALAAELPVACTGGLCGTSGSNLTWVTGGAATLASSTNQLVINQTSEKLLLNWSSFNIGADGKVQFIQPDANAIALNRIFQADPSSIFGTLSANGQVYLINQNGFLFGSSARVNTGGLLVSTLAMSDRVFNAGILAPEIVQNAVPVLTSDGRVGVLDAAGHVVRDASGNPLQVKIDVQAGAQLATNSAGQRLMLASQEIDNAGALTANDGQVLLAAGQKVYLQASADSNLRGLLVEVDAGGKAWNTATGAIQADRGNVTLVGLAVNQDGRISATTSVAQNGSIRLLAADTPDTNSTQLTPRRGGVLQLGSQSITQILPDADGATAVDDQAQPKSSLEFLGKDVIFSGGSTVKAPSANMTVSAAASPSNPALGTGAVDTVARIRVDAGATIDLSGATVEVPVERNLVSVELRANELKDSPNLRDGPLRGQTVIIDARTGTPIADASGAIGLTARTAGERNSTGGTVSFSSGGDIVVAPGATVNVSGGAVNYLGGTMQTTMLVKSDGTLVDIGSADPNGAYVGVYNPQLRLVNDRWGTVSVIPTPGLSRYEAGYTQGAAAGSITIQAPRLALDGRFLGKATSGINQRTAATLAAGGQFVIGSTLSADDLRAPAITLVNTAATVAPVDDNTLLPANTPLRLPVQLMTEGGFTRIAIASNQGITVDPTVAATLLPKASLSFTAPRIDLNGTLRAPGGAFSFTTPSTLPISYQPLAGAGPGVFLAPGSSLDVSGRWVNDQLAVLAGGMPVGAAIINGGSISLRQQALNGTLLLGANATLQASGGGWIRSSGSLTGGSGGSISLVNNAIGDTVTTGSGVNLEAFGVNGASGGTLTLEVPRLAIETGGNPWAKAQTVTYAPGAASATGPAFILDTSLFSDHGFSNYVLTADGQDVVTNGVVQPTVTVAANADLQFATSTWLPDAAAANRASAGSLVGHATPVLLPGYQRLASSLTLNALSASASSVSGPLIGGMVVGTGARLTADAGSSFSFNTRGGSLLFDASLRAPSGSVSLAITTPGTDPGFVASQRIGLGANAAIDVSGQALYLPNDAGLKTGTLTNGGSIRLVTTRGSVVTTTGSLLNVSGATAPFDLPASSGGYARTTLGSNGGSLTVIAPESISLLGSLQSAGGASQLGVARGGSLDLEFTSLAGFSLVDPAKAGTFPTGQRVIRLQGLDPVAENPASARTTILGEHMLETSGLDTLFLAAEGGFQLGQGLDLQMGRSLTLQGPSLAAVGSADVRVSAPYVSLGTGAQAGYAATAATPGTGSLQVVGDFIDVVGNLALRGFQTATLASATDIRFRGNELTPANTGSLAYSGFALLQAQRVYASTASNITLSGPSTSFNTIEIGQAGQSSGVPLSAGSSISIQADQIFQGGTLLAPFGSLSLSASQSLQLGAGSVTSVSGAAALIPYGRVDNGTSWGYALTEGALLTSTPLSYAPQRSLSLSAPSVSMATGSIVDVSGGGDLYAYQWMPGTGGSKDALSATVNPNQFAIVPTLGTAYGAYDPLWYSGSSIAPGTTIHLGAANSIGLAAGTYAVLPARYALLAGAYLVSAKTGTQDLPANAVAPNSDGSVVVAGYLSFGNTTIGGNRYTGYTVTTGAQARRIAEYTDYKAGAFFAAKPAGNDGFTRQLPADAARLVLSVTQALAAAGQVNGRPASGGVGAAVEISAPSLEIVGSGPATTPGAVQIAASTLQSWQPGRLLLGGVRTATGANSVQVTSSTVHVDAGTSLTAPEITMVATGQVLVDAGAHLATPSAAADGSAPAVALAANPVALSLTGPGATGASFVSLSDFGYYAPTRPVGAPGPGKAIVASGASLATRGALEISTPGGASIADGTLSGTGASWLLDSTRVILGNASATPGATVLDDSLLTAAGRAASLSISSTAAIDVFSSVQVGSTALATLNLSTPALRALGTGLQAGFTAARVTVKAGSGAVALVPAGSSNSLAINASEIDVGDGTFTATGFDSAVLAAANGVVGTGKGGFTAASGSLAVVTPEVTAVSGADLSIASPSGSLTLTAPLAAGAGLIESTGGAIRLSGVTVNVDTTLRAHSGLVRLQSTGDLTLGTHAAIDTSGMAVVAGTALHDSGGGLIQLVAGGNFVTLAGASLDVSGHGETDAGTISVDAVRSATTQASFRGQGGVAHAGGSIRLSAGTLDDFQSLNSKLETGGFTGARSIQVATGDLVLAAGQAMTARNVRLVADSGQVIVNGTINASGALTRGSIDLYAGRNLQVGASAVLSADVSTAGLRGGNMLLSTTGGTLNLAAGARLSAIGDGGNGNLTLRAPSTATDVAINNLPADLSGFANVYVQPILTSVLSTGVPDSTTFDTLFASTGDWTNGATGVLSRLGAGAGNVHLQPFVDVRATGNLVLPALDLSQWRFNSEAMALSVRAGGSMTVAGGVSDGVIDSFDPFFGNPLLDLGTDASSSINLVSGANLASAAADATVRGSTADLTIAAAQVVRTGTGSISLTAGRDLLFGTGASVQTLGTAGTDPLFNDAGMMAFARNGGDIHLSSARNVAGSPVTQSNTAWQLRSGIGAANWGNDINQFRWNVGTLGGGDLTVVAGGTINNLSATAADSGTWITPGAFTHFAGGNVDLRAVGDIGSLYLLAADGVAKVASSGALNSARSSGRTVLGSLFLVEDASLDVRARGDIQFEGVVNATMIGPQLLNSESNFFYSYGPDSAAAFTSNGGSISYVNSDSRLILYTGLKSFLNGYALADTVTPGTFSMAALGGDITFAGGQATLFPQDNGQLDLFAKRDIVGGFNAVLMSDATVTALPGRSSAIFNVIQATTPVLSASRALRHLSDAAPASIAAGRDISNLQLELPKAALLSAGRDVTNLTYHGQNLRSSDLTLVSAGRDISYATTETSREIRIGGPGTLEVVAGRNVDLAFSQGITTAGGLLNSALPSHQGADLITLAGLGAPLGTQAFLGSVVAPSAAYRQALVDYVGRISGTAPASYDAALATFEALEAVRQRPFLSEAFFKELVTSGREANATPGVGFSRGFAAIDALFPASRDANSPFSGNLSMAFSRIYTLDGGTISLLVPGGLLNVGLANPPPDLGTRKKPSELGIVAEGAGDVRIYTRGDVLVNQSRIFTLGGGDIAIWSTDGNIDAGKGAKSAISAPPPTITVDPSGRVTINFSAAVAGSGIRTIAASAGAGFGNVDLIAPNGFVNAGDAGIGSSGNLNVAALSVVGLDNIQVGGTSTGVPPETGGLGATLSSVASAGTSASSSASSGADGADSTTRGKTPLAQEALSWLEVFVLGLGEDNCRQDDLDCLKRQKKALN